MRFAYAWLFLVVVPSARAENLSVLPPKTNKGSTKAMLNRYLLRHAHKALRERTDVYEGLKTLDQIKAYQKRLREFFIDRLGGLPKKTRLNARIVGRLKGDECLIENILFESQPEHYVSANLYLPLSKPPYPAVLVPCGHTANGKTGYQKICILLAKNGLAAFCYDPIGQGERYQLLTASGKPRHRSTTEHTLLGVGSILVGRNTATYRIWDGIRAVDYLTTRKDIDASKLGCTGISGGGTLTEYLMALDDRIVAAAPGCAPMTFAARIDTIGPGDAEQNIFGQIANGMDHGDYTLMRAPKPTLLLTATRDFVSIDGAWDLFREAKRLYSRMGYHERVSLLEADEKHGYTRPLRIGATRWMRRWLLSVDDAITEPELSTRTHQQLSCTPKGQVQLIDGARSVMDLNVEVAKKYEPIRKQIWSKQGRSEAIDNVRRLARIRPLRQLPEPRVRTVDKRIERKSYSITKMAFEPEEGIVLPAMLLEPDKVSGRYVLFVDGKGKPSDVSAKGVITSLLSNGSTVLAVDLRGMGETGPSPSKLYGDDFDNFFLAYLLDKSLLGMRTEDILVCSRYLRRQKRCQSLEIIAVGTAGPPALHAAALQPDLFSRVILRNSATTWLDVVRDPNLSGRLVNAVHGALQVYDLSDLVDSLPKERVWSER